MKSQTQQSRIPAFASIQEAAEFWDTHDSTDFEDEWEPVDVEFAPDLRHRRIVEITLDDETAEALFALARQHGVRSADLALPWLKEGLARALSDANAVSDATTRTAERLSPRRGPA